MTRNNVTNLITQAKVKRHQEGLTDAILRLLARDSGLLLENAYHGERHHD
jgi:hypothetical protein